MVIKANKMGPITGTVVRRKRTAHKKFRLSPMKACLENAARLEREIVRKGGCGVAPVQ